MPTKYAHTNLIAKEWKRLSTFYQEVFGCVPIPPERNLSGEWLDKATRLSGSNIFTMKGVEEILNLQPRNGKGKPHQIKQVRDLILQYNLRLG